MKRFIHLIDKRHQLIEVASEGSDRFNIWNKILDRNLKDFDNLPKLKLIEIETNDLIGKIEQTLIHLIEENKNLPNDHPTWKGRFKEEEIFVEIELFGETHKLCNTGRENTIIFLGQIINFLHINKGQQLFEIIGFNHSEIEKCYK